MERHRRRGPQRVAAAYHRTGAALAAGAALSVTPRPSIAAVTPSDPAGPATIALLALVAGTLVGGVLVYLAVQRRLRAEDAQGAEGLRATTPLALRVSAGTIEPAAGWLLGAPDEQPPGAALSPYLDGDIDPIVAVMDRSSATTRPSGRTNAERPVWVRRLDSRIASPGSPEDAVVAEATGRGDGGAQTIGRRTP